MKGRSKKITVAILSASLVLTLSIGTTLAYMTRETEKRTNNFTFAETDKALNAMLTEPDWDGVIDYQYDDNGDIKNYIYDYIDDDGNPATAKVPVYGYTDGDKSQPVTNENATAGRFTRPVEDTTDTTYAPVYGSEMAKNMIPGQSADKNPIITNTGVIVDEWVAAKVTFVYGQDHANAGKTLNAVDLAKVMGVLEISWNVGTADNEWDRVVGTSTSVSQVFYYRQTLAHGNDGADPGEYGESTTAIFDDVKVKATATTADMKALEAVGGFAIYIEGFAAQKDVGLNTSNEADYDVFKAWGFSTDTFAGTTDDNVVFTNSPTDTTAVTVTDPGITAKPKVL